MHQPTVPMGMSESRARKCFARCALPTSILLVMLDLVNAWTFSQACVDAWVRTSLCVDFHAQCVMVGRSEGGGGKGYSDLDILKLL